MTPVEIYAVLLVAPYYLTKPQVDALTPFQASILIGK